MRFALALGFFLVASCAKPTYVNPPPPSAGEEQKDSATPACDLQFPVSQLCLSWKMVLPPTDNTPGTMRLKIWRPNVADRSPVMIAVPGVGGRIEMANMPHGTWVVVAQEDVGTYLFSHVFFSMHGPWYIYVDLKDAAGNVSEELRISLSY